jgi:2-keto-4-pentenoate hydratase/2-oxohepta-3-ene-1,7-dioic acid hydratase in catechol pathway
MIGQQDIKNLNDCSLGLFLNGKLVQNGKISDMVFDIPTLISFISSKMTLEVGDLILTGTPEGVGEFKDGDVLDGVLKENGAQLVDFRFNAKLDS